MLMGSGRRAARGMGRIRGWFSGNWMELRLLNESWNKSWTPRGHGGDTGDRRCSHRTQSAGTRETMELCETVRFSSVSLCCGRTPALHFPTLLFGLLLERQNQGRSQGSTFTHLPEHFLSLGGFSRYQEIPLHTIRWKSRAPMRNRRQAQGRAHVSAFCNYFGYGPWFPVCLAVREPRELWVSHNSLFSAPSPCCAT